MSAGAGSELTFSSAACALPDAMRGLVMRVNMRSFNGSEVAAWEAQGVAEVELTSNSLMRLPAELTSLAPSLKALTVRWNLLTTLPASIGRLRLLQTLDLSFNRLERLPPQLAELHCLTVLCLSDNELSALPDGMGDLRSLETLHLQYNQLKSLPCSLANIPHLSVLSLSGNPWVPR